MSDVKYEQAREAVKEQVNDIYELDQTKITEVKERLASFVSELAEAKDADEADRSSLYESCLLYTSEIPSLKTEALGTASLTYS